MCDPLLQLVRLLLEAIVGSVVDPAELFQLVLEVDDRPLEVEVLEIHPGS
jgi:hypothetical protein